MKLENLKISEALNLLLGNNVGYLDADVRADDSKDSLEIDYNFVGWWDEKKNKYVINIEIL